MTKQEELIKLILKGNLIGQRKITDALEESKKSKKSFEDVLISKQYIDSELLAKTKSTLYNLEYVSLFDVKIEDSALNAIPLEVAENYHVVCFELSANLMKVGLEKPDDFRSIGAIDFLAKKRGLKVKYF